MILATSLLGCVDAATGAGDQFVEADQSLIVPPTVIASDQSVPLSVVADATTAYWINVHSFETEPGDIMSTPKAGGGRVAAVEKEIPDIGALHLDGDRLFWPMGAVDPKVGGIQTRLKIGGPVTDLVKSLRVFYLLPSGTSVYFVSPDDGGFVGRVSKSGGFITKLATNLGPGLDNIPWMALSGDRVVFTQSTFEEECDGRVRYVSKNGGAVVTVASKLCNLISLEADATSVYWTDYDSETNVGRLMRQKLALTAGPAETIDTVAGPASFTASDANFVYYIGRHNGIQELRKIPKLFGLRTVIATDPGVMFTLSIDDTHAYWTTPLTGEVKRVAR